MRPVLRIATLNVNGIRASLRRGLGDWLTRCSPDVLCCQEVRCPPEKMPVFPGYEYRYAAGDRIGRNGVAIFTRQPMIATRSGFGNRRFDNEGRYLEVDLDPVDSRPGLTVGSLYLPKGDRPLNGPAADAKFRRKLAFMRSFRAYLSRARKNARASGREFIVTGDFNIAHSTLDVKNWRGNQKNSGFLPQEREWFTSILGPRTLIDVVRGLHPQEPGPYTWWTWRGKAFDNDTGWRIDYQLATPGLAGTAASGGTDREASYEARMSDHSPVVVDYDL
jgi:exodeoxyribonuclease-3